MSILDKLTSLFKKNNEKKVEEKKQVEQEAQIKELTPESLAEEQKVIDELYKTEGLTDKVLDMQVALNEKRNKLNIPDENNIINDEGFVQ